MPGGRRMNEIGGPRRTDRETAEGASSQRSTVPIDLVVFVVRVAEFATVILAGVIALSFWADRIPTNDVSVYSRSMLGGALIFALVAEIMGTYDVDCHFSLRKAWQRVIGSWLVTGLFLVTVGFLLEVSEDFSRGWALTWFVTAAIMLAGTRAAMTMWIRRLKGQGVFNSRVAIFGAAAQGQRLAQYIRGNNKLTISLVGFFDDRRDGRVPVIVDDLPVFGTSDDLVAMIRDGLIDQVIVALPWSCLLYTSPSPRDH
jgi:FlaA1/EpsC-like NDP-sugar epimerase